MNKQTGKYEVSILFSIIAALTVFTIIRCMDNTVFGDDAYSIMIARDSLVNTLRATAADVHPPLYYIYFKSMCRLFGNTGFIYHLSGALPFLALLYWSSYTFYKKYGFCFTIIFVLGISFLPQAFNMIIRVRMYTLALLFVTMCFYYALRILECEDNKSWFIFTVCGIGAAYTHYYAFAVVCFIYLTLLIWTIYAQREELKKIFLCIVISIISYIPWMSYFFTTLERTGSDFWITQIPTWRETLSYLFGGSWYGILLFFTMVMLLLLFAKSGSMEKYAITGKERYMIFSAVAIIFFYIEILRLLSYFIQPIFLIRYLYIVIGLLWFTFAYLVTKIRVTGKHLTLAPVVVMLLLFYVVPCVAEFSEDVRINEESNATIEDIASVLQDYPDGKLRLVSDIDIITSRFYHLYFPEASVEWYDNMDWETLESGNSAYAILQTEISLDEEEQLNKCGVSIYKDKGEVYLGRYKGYAYILTK